MASLVVVWRAVETNWSSAEVSAGHFWRHMTCGPVHLIRQSFPLPIATRIHSIDATCIAQAILSIAIPTRMSTAPPYCMHNSLLHPISRRRAKAAQTSTSKSLG